MKNNQQQNDIEKQFTQQLLNNVKVNIPENPFEKANIFSRAFFFWVYPLLKISQKRSLQQEDVFKLKDKDTSEFNFNKFNTIYENVKVDPKVVNKLRTAFFRTYKKEIFISVGLYFLYLLSSVVNMLAIQILLQAFKSDDRGKVGPLAIGLSVMALVYFTQSIIQSNYNFYYSVLTVRMTGALSMKIFQKTLLFPMQRNQFYKIGDILNMIQVDILQIVSYIQSLFTLIFSFIFLILSFYLCYATLNDFGIALTLFACVLVSFSFSLIFGKWYGSMQKKFMHEKDLRMRSLEEMIRGIKTIKYNGLETFFDERIKKLREKELKQLKKQRILANCNEFLQNFSCTFTIFTITFAFGISSFSEFLAIFSSFQLIQQFVQNVPLSVQGIVIGSNSMKRLDNYLTESFIYKLNSDTTEENNQVKQSGSSIFIQNGNFSWNNQLNINQIQNSVKLTKRERESISQKQSSSVFQLKNLNLNVKQGEFVVIYGELGSGKSSILQALLGEMEVQGGENSFQKMVQINGSISLCTQDPWILQDTVKENIIFGQSYDSIRYKQVLQVCSLEEDIAYFVDGDQTNIGEKGDTLSGGQRKRVNLARSIYKDSDIYLLDDPLSALDVGVATSIAQECFLGMLKGKTRVIFTSNLVGMNKADKIILIKNGEIVSEGNYNQIKKIIAKEGNKEAENDEDLEELERSQSKVLLKSNQKPKFEEQNYTKKMIQTEDIQHGYIKLLVFKQFAKDLGGLLFSLVLFLMFIGLVTFFLLTKLIMQDVDDDAPKDKQFKVMMLYCLFDTLRVISIFIYETFVVLRMLSLSRFLHKSIVFNLLRASFTKFYNLITTGRLMNRLSKDIYEVDTIIPYDFNQLINQVGMVVVSGASTIIICQFKIASIAIVYFFIALLISYFFLTAKRQIVRIEATSKSPILQYFSEILRGLTYLRSCVKEELIRDTFQQYVNVDLRNQIALNGIQYWFESIASFLSMFPILISSALGYFDNSISSQTAMLMALQVSNLSISMIKLSQTWLECETRLVNYERCLKLKQNIVLEDYSNENGNIENSLQISIQNNDNSENENKISQVGNQNSQLSHSFNQEQSIIFQNASFQYRADLPNCLSNLNLSFTGNQKIGVVGRTGAGKTSVTLALTKVIDLISGDVIINGKSIKDYSLQELRNIISVVSQEPYIYEGTLKLNLDPYNQYTDKQINNVFQQCRFNSFSSFQKGLNTEISQLGDNLSEGEKQLISIARVILKKSKILIVDEPTSHIDANMEEFITNILYENFTNCLVITIAHKIKTIMSSDKILVLNHGKIQEYDSPQNLLKNKNSQFSEIIKIITKHKIN
ncbi:ABC transporter family protein (macronuclear) [Tetrahymena thermophila SB210]|uniref:ABC transporter family protein n=1 Tax=Tetrahymena thermophila (strain SB210) TaxID=312017 RepID=Q23TU6_TETTS|nr:ABC transporter family protein [Tetrahymena thermophila SB210]EAR99949.2 ABC transporter family protein [Tetrahymena thermophila SB210]|eukprot:XP_001020194.2 ABC transporter family protein [Tetrahymena thermophila SB210]